MQSIEYFTFGMDPFQLQKELGLTSSIHQITRIASITNDFTSNPAQFHSKSKSDLDYSQFLSVLLISLLGNKMDLSLWPVGGHDDTSQSKRDSETGFIARNNQKSHSSERDSDTSDPFEELLRNGERMLLDDRSMELLEYLKESKHGFVERVDIVVDNAGLELFCDLIFADYLICSGFAAQVVLQLKAHPTFVSDAMEKDVVFTIEFLRKSEDGALKKIGDRWNGFVESGKWRLNEELFWVQPWAMWEMSEESRSLYEEIREKSDLVVVKGDANYRRLVGDREWDVTVELEDVLCYFPAPICALRVLKAEVGVGMKKEIVEKVRTDDAEWMVNGKWGVVQFVNTRSNKLKQESEMLN